MKNFNEKINNFLEWCKSSQRVFSDYDTFLLYQMETPNVADLTDEETKYLYQLYKCDLKEKGLLGVIKSDMAKFTLTNQYGWGDRMTNNNKNDICVFGDEKDLLKENTSLSNHINESFENEAISEVTQHGKS